MIFDGHADIWTDIAIKRKNGLKNIFKNYHLEKFRQGGINGGIFVIWTDPRPAPASIRATWPDAAC